MELSLKNKVAIVLGGTRGIGRSIAQTFAREGAKVAVCARNAREVDETVSSLKNHGIQASGGSLDISDTFALKAWIAYVAAELGGIDILVSNAGAMAHGNSEDAWVANFKLDILGGAVAAFDAALPMLVRAAEAKGDAAFVIISSVSAAEADHGGSYGPIKAALIHQAKGLARQYAAKRIRVNVISPGSIYFKGGFWEDMEANNAERFKQFLALNPIGRMGSPQEIANAAVFLASPASAFTTGANLVVDGAFSRRVNF
ncbi:MAG TPA: SDR family oxidoreductase [Rhizomicrobium sp.]|jgi:3-oxoacyl-[acyl-carrier protein] reductase